MTSPSLPSEYQTMRSWVCANAGIGVAIAATPASAHNSLRTFINSSQKKPLRHRYWLAISWP